MLANGASLRYLDTHRLQREAGQREAALNFDSTQSANSEALEVCREIEQALVEKYRSTSLFMDPFNSGQKPVHCTPLRSLQFLDHYLERLKADHEISDIYHLRPMGLNYEGPRITEDGAWRDMLTYLQKERGVEYPTFVVANLDSHQMLVRIAVIEQNRRHRFIEATLDCHRYHGSTSTRGLMARLLEQLPAEYNMWKLAAHNEKYAVAGELGTLYWLIEDQTPGEQSAEAVVQRARQAFDKLCNLDFPGAKLGPSLIQPVEIDSLQEWLVSEDLDTGVKKDVLISYAPSSRKTAGRIEQALVSGSLTTVLSEMRVGAGLNSTLAPRTPLRQCRELCLVLSRESLDSARLRFELGVAWALGLHVVAFLDGIDVNDLRPELEDLPCLTGFDLDDYVEAVAQRGQAALSIRQFAR